jgi:hypothetical protein
LDANFIGPVDVCAEEFEANSATHTRLTTRATPVRAKTFVCIVAVSKEVRE